MEEPGISKQIFDWLKKILYGVLGFWLLCFMVDKCTSEKRIPHTKPYWSNLDPNRSVQDIARYNINEGTVTYRSNEPYREPIKSRMYYPKNDGITIKSGNTIIHTDVSPEELLEQLDLDYNDISDYYGIELR